MELLLLVGYTMHCGTATLFFKILTYTLSQELLFQRMQSYRTANFQQVTSWSFYSLKYPEGGRVAEWYTTEKSFHEIVWPRLLYQNCFLRTVLNSTNYWRMRKCFIFGEFNKNVNFSTKFQCWISWKTSNLRLIIPHCNIFFYKWQ